MSPLDIILRLKTEVFETKIGTVLEQSRLSQPLADAYWWLATNSTSPTQTHVIDNISCDFHTTNRHEIVRFNNLVGEKDIVERFLRSVKPGDTVYDIGANVGLYTCFCAKSSADFVYAFEPHPTNVSRLRDNLSMNSVDAEICQIALGDEDTKTVLVEQDQRAGAGQHSLGGEGKNQVEITMERGDTFVQDNRSPDLMKIDVEGAEMRVLKGFGERIQNCREIFCEIHPEKLDTLGYETTDVESYLSDMGFNISTLTQRDDEFFIRAYQ